MLGFSPLSTAPLGSSGEGDSYLIETLPLKELWASDGVAYLHDVLPAKTSDGAGFGGTLGDTNETLPLKTLFAEPGGAVLVEQFPLKTLVAASAPQGNANVTLPAKTLAASGLVGGVGALSATLPARTLYAYGDEGVAEQLPAKTLEASGLVGTLGTLSDALPTRTLVAYGIGEGLGYSSNTLPALQLSATGIGENLGSLSVALPVKGLLAAGEVGGVGTVAAQLPVRTLDALGYGEITANAELVLPLLQLEAAGFAALPATFRTWVLNMQHKALTEYTGWTFNSYAKFRGATLAASDAGVVALGTQDLDNDAPISALVRDGAMDYDSNMVKRVPYIYTGLTTASALRFSLTTEEYGTQVYTLTPWKAGLRPRRVKTAEGARSRYWQWTLENLDGGDFEVDVISLYPVETSRRVP